MSECTVCNGAGGWEIWFDDLQDEGYFEWEQCSECNGDGYLLSLCHDCGGSGDTDEGKTCSTCKGRGECP